MAFNGLLQGVMQGIQGASDAGAYAAKGLFDDKRKVDVYKEMADIEQEKMLLIDKIKRNRDIEDIAPKSEAETKAYVSKMTNPEAVKAMRTEAEIKRQPESAGSLAQADLARYQLGNVKELDALRKNLANTSDPAERETIKQKINDLSSTRTGSYGDVVSAANNLRMMGKTLREDASLLPEDEKAVAIKTAQGYEAEAAALLKGVSEKRGFTTGQGESKQTGYPEGTKLIKDGQTYVVKNGVPVLAK